MEFTAEQLEQLDEYIIDKIGMELQDNRITEVSLEIEFWESAIVSEEFKNDDHTGDLEIIEELKKYKDYYCAYAIDTERSGVWGQAYIILDKDLNYIDFVRTI